MAHAAAPFDSAIETAAARAMRNRRCDMRQLVARIQSTSFLMSPSGTLFGGIGIEPHAPLPPVLTLAASLAGAEASPEYFFATSRYAGPTSFLSLVWQAPQLYFAASAVPSASGTAAATGTDRARHVAAASRAFDVFMRSPLGLEQRKTGSRWSRSLTRSIVRSEPCRVLHKTRPFLELLR